ncbi:MAG: hypothetical protein ACE5G9_05710 [Nitrospinales bacterium]
MKFKFEDKALEFLRARGASELTLDIEEISTPCCTSRLPEVKLSHTPPRNPDRYRNFSVRGINVHVSKMLRTGNTLTVFLSKPFKKLEVAGLNLVL